MKISKREVKLLLGFFGILIAFLAYQFGFTKMNKEAERISNECASMEKEIADLQAKLEKKDFYLSETERMKKEMNQMLSQFDTYVLPEDDMKFAYQEDNRNTEAYLFINSMSFTDPSVLYTTGSNTDNMPQNSNVVISDFEYPTYYLYGRQTAFGLECSYKGLKTLITDVFLAGSRKGIDTISLTFDDTTGQLSGNMTMNSYFVMGLDKPYVQPDLTPVRQGTDNVFGTVDNRDVETVETEETEGAAE